MPPVLFTDKSDESDMSDDVDDFLSEIDDDAMGSDFSGLEPDDVEVTAPDTDVADSWHELAEFDRSGHRDRVAFSFDESGTEALGKMREAAAEDDSIDYETYDLGASVEMTKKVIRRIADEIHQREREGHDIDTLVLGQPQYEVVEAYSQDRYSGRAEDALPIDDIIVVPGPMIHPVIDNRRMLMEYKSEKDD